MKIGLAVELVNVSASWIISAAGITTRAAIAAYLSTYVLGLNFSFTVVRFDCDYKSFRPHGISS